MTVMIFGSPIFKRCEVITAKIWSTSSNALEKSI